MESPEQFHDEAHPEARKITGPLQYGEWGQCIGQSTQNDRRCHGHARGPHGKCNTHGGADDSGAPEGNQNAVGNDGGAPKDNTNAITHAQFAERSRFYRKVMDNIDRRVCDDIYRETVEEFREKNGNPTARDLDTMWQIATEHIQIAYGDNWLADRPSSLRSGNAMVDRETRRTENGGEYHKYKEAVTVSTKLKLRKEHRQWLKQNNMTNDPESQLADSVGDLSSIILEEST
ncbi:hypothetical protein [Halostagnicola sp. A-GB9-2]|uniref:hypothetical protein n=1 Tax=Halostagnicola sp. A-GB9-2 TaxID=3048066 RepID=UPI0024BFFC9E|nr:hypothetical protein [Halostagnicola sp. A-GB9-2]MDJ1433602.1 hypothetical protein [Halostagnicola sp. A-GB9-2]